MCRSMADIRSTAAEIRRGKKRKKKERRRKETTGQKYNGPLLHRAAINTLIFDEVTVKNKLAPFMAHGVADRYNWVNGVHRA